MITKYTKYDDLLQRINEDYEHKSFADENNICIKIKTENIFRLINLLIVFCDENNINYNKLSFSVDKKTFKKLKKSKITVNELFTYTDFEEIKVLNVESYNGFNILKNKEDCISLLIPYIL